MKYIDLSHEMKNNLNVYPGDPKFSLNEINSIDGKEEYSLFKMSGSLHTGTHIDAPYHYIPNGKMVSNLDINKLIGKASILKVNTEITNKSIKIDDIKMEIPLKKIVILNTRWYKHWGENNYFNENPYISEELADLLIENEIFTVAIDTPSVDKADENIIHKKFLKNDIMIVENLTNMDKLVKNEYFSYFIPMKIAAEASYIRAFVKDE